MLDLLNSLLIGFGGAFVLHAVAAWSGYARRLVVGPPPRALRGLAPLELMSKRTR